ncbi:MAG: DUF4861 family protein [Rubrivivax sp.]|nr:DUF4861 family protein [Pyrinomonadaceae bacterium]
MMKKKTPLTSQTFSRLITLLLSIVVLAPMSGGAAQAQRRRRGARVIPDKIERRAAQPAPVAQASSAADWYTQGTFAPVQRVALTLVNDLPYDRINNPVVITPNQVPMLRGAHELSITLVDPALNARPEPSGRQRAQEGAHGRLGETSGRSFDYQLDDLDKDGIWDELFFMADMKAKESKTIYVYLGFQQRGWNPHRTHAAVASYMRHIVPFWESEHVGWKLWYPTATR